jgi:nitrilase
VENQLFVIGANMVDREHPRRALWGGSAIIDPWGNILASLDDQQGVAVAEIDLTMIDNVRAKMPVADHRKI